MVPFNSYRVPHCLARVCAGEHSLAMTPGARRADIAVAAFPDFQRDWHRWNAAERSCAAAFGMLWASCVATAILGQAAFQHTFAWAHAMQ
jgi:hypothetical protein